MDDGAKIEGARLPAPRSAIDAVGVGHVAVARLLLAAPGTVQPMQHQREVQAEWPPPRLDDVGHHPASIVDMTSSVGYFETNQTDPTISLGGTDGNVQHFL